MLRQVIGLMMHRFIVILLILNEPVPLVIFVNHCLSFLLLVHLIGKATIVAIVRVAFITLITVIFIIMLILFAVNDRLIRFQILISF